MGDELDQEAILVVSDERFRAWIGRFLAPLTPFGFLVVAVNMLHGELS